METNKDRVKRPNLPILLSLLLSSLQIINAQEVYRGRAFDIDGYVDGQHSSVPEEVISPRDSLIKNTNAQIDSIVDNQRMKSEKKIRDKISHAIANAFNEAPYEDAVSAQSSAISKKTTDINHIKDKGDTIKIIPSVGIANMSSNSLDVESNLKSSLALETDISDRISAGVFISYTSISMFDMNNNYNGFNHNNTYYGGCFYNSLGICSNYNEREIKFQEISIGLNSKYFLFSKERRIRPFAGAAIDYNRNQLSYSDDGAQLTYNYAQSRQRLGGEKYISSNFSVGLIFGGEVSFNDSLGLNLDVQMHKKLSSLSDSEKQSYSSVYNRDLDRLENISDELNSALNTSVNLGVILKF